MSYPARAEGLVNSTYFLRASQFRTQFNPLTVKVALDLLISSTGCTYYLHWCISSFDSLAESEVNMQHLPAITQNIWVRWTRHVGHCRRSKREIISDEILWTPTYGHTNVGPTSKNLHSSYCTDTAFHLKDVQRAIANRDEWREWIKRICSVDSPWLR